jgi:hypothetical protein
VRTTAAIGAVFLILFAGSSSYGQGDADSPQYAAPSDLTILKHHFGGERRFVTESTPQSERGGEPATRVVSHSVMTVSVKAKSNSPKNIVGLSWYFVLAKASGERVFSVPFFTEVDLTSRQTKTFKAEIERLPKHPQAISVEELENPDKGPARERIVVTCVMFADGTTSPLNEASKVDCQRLQTSPQIRKKIEKL